MITEECSMLDQVVKRKELAEGERYSVPALKRVFRNLHGGSEAIEILSVYGSNPFHKKILSAAPESVNITHVRHRLRDIRGMEGLDLVFYLCPQDNTDNMADLLEDLCFCRMLLKPGSFMYMTVSMEGSQYLPEWIARKRVREISWLHQAGYVNICTSKLGAGCILIGGQRPAQNF